MTLHETVLNKASQRTGSARRCVGFYLDNRAYGIPFDRVRETVRVSRPSCPAKEGDLVVGIISVHGQIVPVVNLSSRLGKTAEEPSPRSEILVVETREGGLTGLLVDRVAGPILVPEECLDTESTGVCEPRPDYVVAVAQSGSCRMTILDIDPLLDVTPALRPDIEKRPGSGGPLA